MKVAFHSMGEIEDERLLFAVICAACKGKWLFVRHRERNTWELPGGHREPHEDIRATAERELYEETGATSYEMEAICDYSVTSGELTTYGRLFYAKVSELGFLPESEIGEVKTFVHMPDSLTYAKIQPHLHRKVLQCLRDRALAVLERDRVRNINIINIIRNYPPQTLDMVGDSVLARVRSDEDWVYISSKSEDEFFRLIEGLDEEDKCFALLADWMIPHIVGNRETEYNLSCVKLVYDEGISPQPIVHEIVDLTVGDAPYIYDNSRYQEYTSIQYIEDRIRNGVALGIRQDEKLVAWSLTHDDGSIGFMNVQDEYRRKGYATSVTAAMVKRLLEQGELPFVHIEDDNFKSMNLALKSGFRKYGRVYWIKLK